MFHRNKFRICSDTNGKTKTKANNNYKKYFLDLTVFNKSHNSTTVGLKWDISLETVSHCGAVL